MASESLPAANKGATITLYWLEQSRSQRILWMLEELGLSYNLKTFKRGKDMLAGPELKEIHPLGKSPVVSVETPDTSEPVVLAESGAIVEFLSEHFGTWLIPKRYEDGKEGKIGAETETWRRYRFFMHYAEGSLMSLLLLSLMTNVIKTSPVPFFIRPVTNRVAGKIHDGFLDRNFDTHFTFLENQIQSTPNGGEFLCGTELTGADILMSFPLGAAKQRGLINETQHPGLCSYVDRLNERDASKNALAKLEEVGESISPSLSSSEGITEEHRPEGADTEVIPTQPGNSVAATLVPPSRLMAAFQGNHNGNSNKDASAARGVHSSRQSLSSRNLTNPPPPFSSQPNNPPSNPPQSVHGFPQQVSDSLDAPYLSTSNVDAAQQHFSNAPEALGAESTFARDDVNHNFLPPGLNPNWDPSTFNSFLDINQVYQPQGQLANEQATQLQAVDQSTPYNFWNRAEPASTAGAEGARRPTTQATPVSTQPASSSRQTQETQQPSGPSGTQPWGIKRKADSDPSSPAAQQRPAKLPTKEKPNSNPPKTMSPITKPSTQIGPLTRGPDQDRSGSGQRGRESTNGTSKPTPQKGRGAPTLRPPGLVTSDENANTGSTLPPEKVFPIQIGSELFRLSGASIGSDAPSYFSRFFEEQLRQSEDGAAVRTLYIDRDPVTFRDISRHLQGYHIKPQDGAQFVKLFADAQFYSLPRLMSQLFESEIFVQIGDRHFHIPRDIFSDPGNSPNYFSLGFAAFFASPDEVFPGLDRQGLLRPPSIVPPSVPNRSAEVFAQLLHFLRGYPVHIESEDHRAELLRDCRYFHLRGLEQKLIAHEIRYNAVRQKTEISLRIEDIRPSGISFSEDQSSQTLPWPSGCVYYARPFVDDKPYELIVELGDESTILDLNTMKPEFNSLTKARISSLLQVISNKVNLAAESASSPENPRPQPSQRRVALSDESVWALIDRNADIQLDGEPYTFDGNLQGGRGITESTHAEDPSRSGSVNEPPSKRRRPGDDRGQWVIRRGQWRLRLQPSPRPGDSVKVDLVIIPVKLDAFTEPRSRNMGRRFLG
ncbi:hypothetical protein FQN54_001332 [Arachnomyces sp. PD_36]|nr:hypothetical protein FQN54_001332 [Arachnomyces sp. PD_36]